MLFQSGRIRPLFHIRQAHYWRGIIYRGASPLFINELNERTMEEKVTIIQTSNTAEGTTIKLAPDVAYIEATFEDRLVSRVIVKMKDA
jgi:hypothetical protein